LRASAAEVGSWLLRLALGLVDNASLDDLPGLHGSQAGENLQNLIMAANGDLAIEQQLIHGSGAGKMYGERCSEKTISICNIRQSVDKPAVGR